MAEKEPGLQAGVCLLCPWEEDPVPRNWGITCFHVSRPGPGHQEFLFWEDRVQRENGSHLGASQAGEWPCDLGCKAIAQLLQRRMKGKPLLRRTSLPHELKRSLHCLQNVCSPFWAVTPERGENERNPDNGAWRFLFYFLCKDVIENVFPNFCCV